MTDLLLLFAALIYAALASHRDDPPGDGECDACPGLDDCQCAAGHGAPPHDCVCGPAD